jgi:hypothetical protein
MKFKEIELLNIALKSTKYPSINRTKFIATVNENLLRELLDGLLDEYEIKSTISDYKFHLQVYINDYTYLTWDGIHLILNVNNQSYIHKGLDKFWLLSTFSFYM